MRARLCLRFSLTIICLTLAAKSAAAQLQWSSSQKYDTGQDTAVAMHVSGLILEFHRTHILAGTELFYHVGKVIGTNVTWGGSQRLPAEGTWPNVAISKEGYVLFVWSTGLAKRSSALYYMTGKIDPNGEANQSISWLTQPTRVDAGFHSSIAMNDNGIIAEVHESGSNGTGLYYRVGQFKNPKAGDFTIVWNSGEWGVNYDDGINPHIAFNNQNQVVEVHQVTGQHLLHYHRGVVLKNAVIDFQASQRYDNWGYEPSVALSDGGLAVEIHRNDPNRRAYAMTGTLSLAYPERISWSTSVDISNEGGSIYPAVATNGNYAIGTWTSSGLVTNALYYSVARIP